MTRKAGTHKRNINGIAQHTEKKRLETFRRCEQAIRKMLRERKPINFNAVSRESGCSVSWLYKESEVAARIRSLRTQQSSKKVVVPKIEQATVNSLRSQIKTLRERNKDITAENELLKKQIAVAYGLLRDHNIQFPQIN